jgi:large subunit ribosomal protein L5
MAEKAKQNPMEAVRLEKVTLNIGAGSEGEKLEKSKVLMQRITQRTPLATKARTRNPTFKIKTGDVIGVKVTLRGKPASEFLKRALDAVDYTLSERSFDAHGNVAFGVREYIDFPGIKYDPALGMLGFDVCVTLSKAGKRVAQRKIAKGIVGKRQLVTKQDAMDFMQRGFNVKLGELERM